MLTGKYAGGLHRHRRWGEQGGNVPLKKIPENIFWAIIIKIWAFLGKNHLKFGILLIFQTNIIKNSGISIIFWARIM